jgi:hypothetical protein
MNFYKFSVFYLAIFRGIKQNQEKVTEKEKKRKKKSGQPDREARPGPAGHRHTCRVNTVDKEGRPCEPAQANQQPSAALSSFLFSFVFFS